MTETRTEETKVKEKNVRGKFCGYYNGQPVYYSRPHLSLASKNNKFVRHLSQKEAKRFGLTEDENKNSAKIFSFQGYIGPDRHKGSAKP